MPLVPVSGVVKFSGGSQAPVMGSVEFHPDTGKGNNNKEKSGAMIKPDGTYTLSTDGREGAPVGWYKVVVNIPLAADAQKAVPGKPPPQPPPPSKYANPETSGISIEVKDGAPAGAYDLSLVK